jgi:hypothetical protein
VLPRYFGGSVAYELEFPLDPRSQLVVPVEDVGFNQEG